MSPPDDPRPEKLAFDQHLRGLSGWEAAAIRAHTRWPSNYAVSAEQFAQARAAATSEVIR